MMGFITNPLMISCAIILFIIALSYVQSVKEKKANKLSFPTKYNHWKIITGSDGLFYPYVGDGVKFKQLGSYGKLPGYGDYVSFKSQATAESVVIKCLEEQAAPYGKLISSGCIESENS